MKIAIAGDALLVRPVSHLTDPRAAAIFDLFRNADIAFMNCETVLVDYDQPGLYPSAEPGWTAMRSPPAIAKEFQWLNARLVALANNHLLDFGQIGLATTRAAFDGAGIAHAGAGRTLSEARSAGLITVAEKRVALISMTTSATASSRAADPHGAVPGRPGLNPLSYHYEADEQIIGQLVAFAKQTGSWVCQPAPHIWEINPPGLHNSFTRYYLSARPGCRLILDPDDVEANLRAIETAKADADIVIAHIHNHEWDGVSGSLRVPPDFMVEFARSAIAAGADIVVAQGCHAPFRGIEIHQGKPIFYDLGDLFLHAEHIDQQPREFFLRHASKLKVPPDKATMSDGFAAMLGYGEVLSPAGGYFSGGTPSGAVAVLHYDAGQLSAIHLHPFAFDPHAGPICADHEQIAGTPLQPPLHQANEIISEFAELSAPFGTHIRLAEGIGIINL